VQFSDDEKHKATLDLLREVADFLDRLPPVPVTRDMSRKVRAHLEEPTQRLVEHVEHERKTKRRGETFTPAGLPLLAAELREQLVTVKRLGALPREELVKVVRVTMRSKPKALNVDREVLAELKHPTGIRIALTEEIPAED
jgi:hypothetical protein